ncbi:HesA/MoeB/ThiF family protein [Streptococcus suis]
MKLILNTIIHPIFKKEESYFFKYNNSFIEIADIDFTEYVLNIFNNSNNNSVERLELTKMIQSDLELSLDEAEDIVVDLINVGFLTEQTKKDRYFTNTLFFSLFDNKLKLEFQKQLKNSVVCVLGLGGSSLIIQQLAQIGIGKISGLDYDILEESNLNRQVIFREQDIGKLKNEALEENLKEINSELQYDFRNIYVNSQDSIKDIIASADIVIIALDEPIIDSSILVYDECKRQKKKIISGGVWGDSINYTYFDYSLPEQPCYRCLFQEDLDKGGINKEYVNNIKGRSYSDFNTTTIFVGGILAGIISTEIVKILTGYSDNIPSGSMLTMNTTTWELNIEKIHCNKLCIKCQEQSTDG